MSQVLYPENLFNRVTYTYGKACDPFNRGAGRIALVEDASGGEAYSYGRMGEVTKTVRTVMASLADVRTYIYGATYDSWNRVRTHGYQMVSGGTSPTTPRTGGELDQQEAWQGIDNR